jgi:hypothetical protein
MPPVQYVAFHELMSGVAQDLFAREVWLDVDQRHHILKLVAEAIRTTRLVQRRPGP